VSPNRIEHAYREGFNDAATFKSVEPLAAGTTIRRKGRNVYRNGTWRQPWPDEAARRLVASEKHARGDVARAVRQARREEYDGY